MIRVIACGLVLVMVNLALTGCVVGQHPGVPSPTGFVTLQWDPNTEPDLAGYKVYSSTLSGLYGDPIATLPPSVTTYQSTGLVKGVTYFFVVSAYNSQGIESLPFEEVARTIP
ncbi:MAG: hypothetical protein OJF50_000923 [Nitrospira sp.]|nr:hypothetical protein [Nitrospira sp.]